MKIVLFLSALVFTLFPVIFASSYAVGKPQTDQELLMVATKFTPVFNETKDEISLVFDYDGTSAIKSITQAYYSMEMVFNFL